MKERALKRSVSPIGNHEDVKQEAKLKEKDDGVCLAPLGTEDDAKRDEDCDEKEDASEENAGGAGPTGIKHPTPDSPEKAMDNGTSPERQQQQQRQQQRRQRPAVRSPREKDVKDGDGSSVTLEQLLAAVSGLSQNCLLYTSPSPRDATLSRMPSSA